MKVNLIFKGYECYEIKRAHKMETVEKKTK